MPAQLAILFYIARRRPRNSARRRRRGAPRRSATPPPTIHRAGNASFTSVPKIRLHCASNAGSNPPIVPGNLIDQRTERFQPI
jgi:hypothetical protein